MAQQTVTLPQNGGPSIAGTKGYIFTQLTNGQPGSVLAQYNGFSVIADTTQVTLNEGFNYQVVFLNAQNQQVYNDTVALGTAYLSDAPMDGKTYGRKNGAWVELPS
jgi:hypothetical protein